MAKSWTDLLHAEGIATRSPVDEGALCAGEELLGVAFPPDLRALYKTSDGVLDEAGEWYVIWPLVSLIRDNSAAWRSRRDLPPRLLGFGDDGAGSWFCIQLDQSGEVVVWNFIDAESYPLASTLQQFWTGWLSGEITT